MVNIPFLLVLIAAIIGSNCATYTNVAQSYSPQRAESGKTQLIVELGIHGEIRWHTTAGGALMFTVNKTAETTLEIDEIQIIFDEVQNNTITLTVHRTTPDGASPVHISSIITVMICSLMAGVLLSRRTDVAIAILAVALFLCYAEADTLPRADVDIYVPSNFAFSSVTLKTSYGSIDVDESLITSGASLQCVSGNPLQECPSCCSSNGKCTDGQCQCNRGFKNGTADCSNRTEVTFQLYVNPADPTIIAANTPEGDTIFLIGNKSSDGYATSVDEFHIVDAESTTYVPLTDDGSIQSAINSDGLVMDFIWGENYTQVHVTLVLNNGSDQLSINIDLTEPINDTTLNFTDTDESIEKRSPGEYYSNFAGTHKQKPNLKREMLEATSSNQRRKKRQMTLESFATVRVRVLSCGELESNAEVYANALLDYDEETMEYARSTNLIGVQSGSPGLYYVYIPTEAASDIGENVGDVCDAIEMVLSKVCGFYSDVSKVVKRYSKHKLDSLICFAIGRALPIVFPQLRLLPIFRFCKAVFKGVNWYCDNINEEIPLTDKTVAQVICDSISDHIDKAADFFRDQDVFFTPSALFPLGNTVTAQGQVLNLEPGSSEVLTTFTIENDQNDVKITSLTVNPPDPDPNEDYIVTVVYECYSSSVSAYMHIIGTDNYTDEIDCFSGPMCQLHVPGAVALVEDIVTVNINDGDTAITRTVYIIF